MHEPTRRAGTLRFLLLLNLFALVLFVGAGVVYLMDDRDAAAPPPPLTYEYTVPPDAGLALDRGEQLDFFPARLDVRVGDKLVIHNNDNRGHTVGPYFVNRGRTVNQTFTAAGTIEGICTIHPSGAVTIVVT